MTSEPHLQEPLLETSEDKSYIAASFEALRKRFPSIGGKYHQDYIRNATRSRRSPNPLRRTSSQAWDQEDALVSDTKKLEYCMVNLKAKENNFPHNGLVWIPIEDEGGHTGTKWRPARLKRKTHLTGGWAVRLPAGLNSALEVELDTSTGYKDYNLHVPTWEDFPDEERAKKLTDWLIEMTYKNALDILEKANTEQETHIFHDFVQQHERLRKALSMIANSFHDHAMHAGESMSDQWLQKWQAIIPKEQIMQAFARLDVDSNGALTCRELQAVMGEIAPDTFSEQQIVDIFGRMDRDKDGEVRLEEFVDWCRKKGKGLVVVKVLEFALHEDERLGLCKSTAISEMSLGLGKSADKTYESPPYEDAYLLLHGISYFVFLVLSFCVMLATNSYILMQFFFLFLFNRTEERLDERQAKDRNFQFFVYFFAIPWMLVIASLFAFEVSGMIRSSMATPQMSRPCAFLVGLHMNIKKNFNQIKHKAGDHMNVNQIKHKAGDDDFWLDLKNAMSYVDSWFTIGVECCMCFGEVGTVIHAVLNREEDFLTHIDPGPWTFYGTNFGLALVITVFVLWGFLWISDHNSEKQTGDRCLDRILVQTLPGRMLNWDRGHTFTVLGMLFISVFLALCNKEVAYEGVILGGWTWAVLTMFLYILSDMTLEPRQRIILNQLDICLQDRHVKPGHMGIRFYDIRAKLTQQLEMLSTKKNMTNLNFFSTKKNTKETDTHTLSVTLRYFLAANVVWGITYPLSLWIENPLHLSVIIVVGCSVMLFIVTQSILPSLTILLVYISGLGYVFCNDNKDYLKQILPAVQAAGPALFLIPVMICWHTVLVRRIPSIRRGSVKESTHPALFHFNVYHGFMLFYSLGSVVFFLMAALSVMAPMTSDEINKMGMSVDPDAQQPGNIRKSVVYPVCKMKWGSQGSDLRIVDMAILAKYAYANETLDFKAAIAASFNGAAGFKSAKVLHVDEFTKIPRMTATKLISNTGRGKATIVLAIKGTSTPSEGFADASLYSGVAILGFLSQFVDIFDLVPNTLIAWVLNHVRLPLVRALENNIIIKATKTTMDYKNEYPDADIVITGHSLGGGIAGAVGSITGVQAVTFSAPGSHFNRFVFNNNFERQWRNWVNVWPEVDVVPKVDRHDEMIQHIDCKDPQTGQLLDKTSCHLATTTICELWRVCGDPRGRAMTLCTDPKLKYVKDSYDESTWGEYIRPQVGYVNPRLPVGMGDLSDDEHMPTILDDPASGFIITLFAAMVLPVSYSLMRIRPSGTSDALQAGMAGALAATEAAARSQSAPA